MLFFLFVFAYSHTHTKTSNDGSLADAFDLAFRFYTHESRPPWKPPRPLAICNRYVAIHGSGGLRCATRISHFTLFLGNLFKTAEVYDGESITITKVSRLHGGAYLCIASNGVPVSVSRRIRLDVHCKY